MTQTLVRPRKLKNKDVAVDSRRYEAVAQRIAALIDAGTLRVGDRVPSVRKMSQQMGVAVGTVLHAYRLLEDRGRIGARPQSGYYVRPVLPVLPEPRVSTPPMQATRPTVGALAMKMLTLAGATDVIPLGAALPSADCLPTRQLNRLCASIARRSSRGFSQYDFPPGLHELRVQIARHYMEAGCALSPEELVTTCGCQEALNLCLRAVARPGDVIAVESPVYYGHFQAIELLGLKALEIPTDPRAGVSIDALQRALRRKKVAACLFVTNCQNPLGFSMSEAHKRQLVALLAEHRVPLIEDDIYGDLSFDPQRPTVCKAFDRDGGVMLCSSFSKTLAPGARVGWCAPGRWLEQFMRIKLSTTLATPTLPQMTLAEFMASGGYAHHLRKVRKLYAEQVRLISSLIERHFPPGTRLTRPSGGYVLWVEMPKGVNSIELFERALAMKINTSPGPLFSASDRYQNCLRISCACPKSDKLEWAIQALGDLARLGLNDQAVRR